MLSTSPTKVPFVVAAEMGYGHLRAALPIAETFGVPLLSADRPPLAGPDEQGLWDRVRVSYELTSRLSQLRGLGGPVNLLLDQITSIPALYPARDRSAPSSGTRFVDRLARRGLGRGLIEALRESGRPLVTTFYFPALAADYARVENPLFCVVTDTDVNRVWAPSVGASTRVRYLVPTRRTARRMIQYGVPSSQVTFTGYPLPDSLVGGPSYPILRRNLARRLVRLDPRRAFRDEVGDAIAALLGPLPAEEEGRPPLVTFAVGGAGAQADLARRFLPSLRDDLAAGGLRLSLVAGTRVAVRDELEAYVAEAGLRGAPGVELLYEPDLATYFSRFDELMARTDVLWSKPSELSFFAALGLPIICAPPVGVHERRNRRWVRESGAGVKQGDPASAGEWLGDLLADGQLAAAAWAGYFRLPKAGLYRIAEAVRGERAPGPADGAG
jgi:hypothetical protein